MTRVGQTERMAPYMTVYLVNFLPKMLYIHRVYTCIYIRNIFTHIYTHFYIYMVLADTTSDHTHTCN
jgi:hypothetical protein